MLWCLIFVAWICTVKNAPLDQQLTASKNTSSPQQHEEHMPDTLHTSGLHSSRSSAETHLDDENVVEGDIILPSDRSANGFLWPVENNDISLPYEITESVENKTKTILGAFKMISSQTCIKFHKRTDETDYLQFLPGKGCASYVGFLGDAQPIYISPFCSVGNLCHEVIHALGLYHEHTRPDRDKYITVQMKNVIPGKDDNFFIREGPTPDIPYDLDSIMHYGKYYFSSNNKATIVPKDSNAAIGQRSHLSKLDVERLNMLYSCDKKGMN